MPAFSRSKLSPSQQRGYDKLDRAGKSAFRANYSTTSASGARKLKPSYFATGSKNAYSSGSGEGNRR